MQDFPDSDLGLLSRPHGMVKEMPPREINAREILQDIRSGMDDKGLIHKYKLSPVSLKGVFDELVSVGLLERAGESYFMPEVKKIDARKMAEDIGYGMTAQELMRCYRLSPRLLRHALEQLVESQILTWDQLGKELALRMEAPDPCEIRSEPRQVLDFDVDLFEPSRPDMVGRILEISAQGFRAMGIAAQSGEVKKLVIGGDPLGQVAPFGFEAQCRWSKGAAEAGNLETGFKIINISEKACGELRKLVELAGLKHQPPGYDFKEC